jgi:OTU domain-containing protein 3
VWLTILLLLCYTDGLTIVDMNADGNCLFRALSDQLFGDYGNHHDEIRSDVCDFMADNQDDFKVFLVFEDDGEEEEDAKDFESYLKNMREDGEWGGNLELVAAARLYR